MFSNIICSKADFSSEVEHFKTVFFQRLGNANPRTYHKPMLHYPHIRHHPLNVIAMKILINLQQNIAMKISFTIEIGPADISTMEIGYGMFL